MYLELVLSGDDVVVLYFEQGLKGTSLTRVTRLKLYEVSKFGMWSRAVFNRNIPFSYGVSNNESD